MKAVDVGRSAAGMFSFHPRTITRVKFYKTRNPLQTLRSLLMASPVLKSALS
jgi:hypothetical protein